MDFVKMLKERQEKQHRTMLSNNMKKLIAKFNEIIATAKKIDATDLVVYNEYKGLMVESLMASQEVFEMTDDSGKPVNKEYFESKSVVELIDMFESIVKELEAIA